MLSKELKRGDYIEAVQNQQLHGTCNPKEAAEEYIRSALRPVVLSMIDGDSRRLAISSRKHLEESLSTWALTKQEVSKLNSLINDIKVKSEST